jgi:hypothetical protein
MSWPILSPTLCSSLSVALPHQGLAIEWWVAIAIIVLGLVIFGLADLKRFRLSRAWAISGVCFAESMRRKVLWVIPLGIIGVLVISLLEHPIDQQESIRQTIRFCLFASGTLVTITAILLACTSLPREIENRVIYTIVTKPTTRLEIVLGKVIGFVRVSGLIVLIMGLFSLVFLEWQNMRLTGDITEQLKNEADPVRRHVLEGYRDAGLLTTLSLDKASEFQVLNRIPTANGSVWTDGGQAYSYVVNFEPDNAQRALLAAAGEDPPRAGVMVISTIRIKRRTPTKDEMSMIEGRHIPMEGAVFGPVLPGQNSQGKPKAMLSFAILGPELNVLVPQKEVNGGAPTVAPDKANPDGSYTIATPLAPEVVRQLLNVDHFGLSVTPETPSIEYEITTTPTVLDVFTPDHVEHVIHAVGPPRFISHPGRYGMQIMGATPQNAKAATIDQLRQGAGDWPGSLGLFRFDHLAIPANATGQYDIRFRGGIIRSGDYDAGLPYSLVAMDVVNRKTGKTTPEPIIFHPETNRDMFVPVPAEFVAGGDFDIYIRGFENSQWIGLTDTAVQFISAEHTFALNLLKSLLVLWMFSILVVVIAIFTSTFVSWPIAVVLTLLILLGHWGVDELGDSLNPGIGRSTATEFGLGRDPVKSKVVDASVEALAKLLRTVSIVLPDVSKFPVFEDISRGVSIPISHLLGALTVLFCYGLPMIVLSFVILKNKEVAP